MSTEEWDSTANPDEYEKALKKPLAGRRSFRAVPGESAGTAMPAVEAAFTGWTAEGRLSHPAFEGLRENERAAEVAREEPGMPKPVSARGSRALVAGRK